MNLVGIAREQKISISRTLILISAIFAGSANAQPLHQVLDSGFPAEDAFPTTWIDNRLVFFTGVELRQGPQSPNSRNTYRGGLKIAAFVWDTIAQTITKFQEAPLRSFCSTGSYVSYQLRERSGSDEVVAIYGGKFGEEKLLGYRPKLPFFNPVSCRYHATSWLPSEAKRRRVSLLLEEHGYVDFGPQGNSSREVRPVLRSLIDKQAIPLAIEPQYLENGRLNFTYLQFSGQYFSRADTRDHSRLSPAFFLKPDGALRKIEFRQDIRVAGVYHATKVGVLLTTDGTGEAIKGGAYLLEGKQMVQVAIGSLRAASVSPDGCRVAFVFARSWEAISRGYQEWKEGKPGNTLRMMDLCKERPK